jgi:hypothetical protein
MPGVQRQDDLFSKLRELEAAIARLETSDKVSNSTVKAATIWFNDGSALQITVGKQDDGTYGISTTWLQTQSGQRLRFFAQPSDPGAGDSDSTVTRIWFQTS